MNEQIGKSLTEQRLKMGLTQQQVANCLKMSRASIVNIEAGRQGLTIIRLFEFCALYGCKIEEVLPNMFNRFF